VPEVELMSTVRPESDDPLEAELVALRPVALTPQVVSRIAEAVSSGDREGVRLTVGGPRVRWIIGALAAGLAASITVTAWVRHAQSVRRHDVATTGSEVRPVVPAAAPPERPVTLATYRSALSRSPEDALALLDRDGKASAPDASPRAFGRLAVATADRGEASTP
jgi:hypothetical protein